MTLWRVLDLYKRDASRRGQAPAKQLTYLGNFTQRSPLQKIIRTPICFQSSYYLHMVELRGVEPLTF